MKNIHGETLEFVEYWNANFDPDETGRCRMVASHAFESGRHKQEQAQERNDAEVNMLEAEAGYSRELIR